MPWVKSETNTALRQKSRASAKFEGPRCVASFYDSRRQDDLGPQPSPYAAGGAAVARGELLDEALDMKDAVILAAMSFLGLETVVAESSSVRAAAGTTFVRAQGAFVSTQRITGTSGAEPSYFKSNSSCD